MRHPYPYPPCYGHVKFSVPSFIRVKGSSTGREIDGNVEIKSCYIEMRRDQLRLDQLLFDRLIRKENVELFFLNNSINIDTPVAQVIDNFGEWNILFLSF